MGSPTHSGPGAGLSERGPSRARGACKTSRDVSIETCPLAALWVELSGSWTPSGYRSTDSRVASPRHASRAAAGSRRAKGSPDYASRRGVRKLAAAAASQAITAYPFPIPGGEPGVWGVHDGDEWFTRHCRKRELEKCKETYERCARDAPAGEGYAAHMCTCADEYYGVCARKSGCSSILMKQCVDEMDKWGGCDSSVCGSNCVNRGEGAIPPDAHVLPVNNFGANALRFSVCFRRLNERSFNRFGMVVSERCAENDFHLCPYWIPPETFTAIAIAHNASYLKMEFCVVNDEGAYGDEAYYNCLTDPAPREYYGTETHWPTTVDVEFTRAPYCGSDLDCPGSSCDTSQRPPICAPHVPGNLPPGFGWFGRGRRGFDAGGVADPG